MRLRTRTLAHGRGRRGDRCSKELLPCAQTSGEAVGILRTQKPSTAHSTNDRLAEIDHLVSLQSVPITKPRYQ